MYINRMAAILVWGIVIVSLAAGCAGKETAEQSAVIATISDSTSVEDRGLSVKIKIEHPKDTTTFLSKAIGEFFDEALGGEYYGNVSDVKELMKFYTEENVKMLKTEYEEMNSENEMDSLQLEYNADFYVLDETEKYITYQYVIFQYTGGAHGLTDLRGATFRKSDGRRMGWDLFTDIYDERIQTLIHSYLRKFFEVPTDGELKDCLMMSSRTEEIPYPQCPPLFTKSGVKLIYGQYEIAPYAAGMPEFIIPYSEISELMYSTAKRLLK